ncbi:uncharacterized protein LOC141818530 [Curcuma longa]|uniref:uncharacterized protein LOC141818530 n=1 Tax=Curcuma longa TaxID=136217 RepID=UPI003D9F7A7C
MPCLIFFTNVSLDGLDTSVIFSEATKVVAKFIGKPDSAMVVPQGSVPISYGVSEQPAAYGELVSVGSPSPDVNKNMSAAVSSILETKSSIPKSRFFLKFYDSEGANFGWNGSTF